MGLPDKSEFCPPDTQKEEPSCKIQAFQRLESKQEGLLFSNKCQDGAEGKDVVYVILYKNLQDSSRLLKQRKEYVRLPVEQPLQGGRPLILHRWEVVLMDNKHFDFKDLMQFGMFIIALLTFIHLISH